MSYYYKEPDIIFKKVSFQNSDYLYINQFDRNISDTEEREAYIYIELKNFYFKKEGKVISFGNHLGNIYSLTGYSESMVNRWIKRMCETILFPHSLI